MQKKFNDNLESLRIKEGRNFSMKHFISASSASFVLAIIISLSPYPPNEAIGQGTEIDTFSEHEQIVLQLNDSLKKVQLADSINQKELLKGIRNVKRKTEVLNAIVEKKLIQQKTDTTIAALPVAIKNDSIKRRGFLSKITFGIFDK